MIGCKETVSNTTRFVLDIICYSNLLLVILLVISQCVLLHVSLSLVQLNFIECFPNLGLDIQTCGNNSESNCSGFSSWLVDLSVTSKEEEMKKRKSEDAGSETLSQKTLA